MIRTAIDFERRGPGSISKELFWYHDHGTFTRLPYEMDEKGGLKFSPPDAFRSMLKTLKPPATRATTAPTSKP